MSIKKLLGTGACMVIIGISAGASYGLFQRLTAQVATPANAQSDANAHNTSSDGTASAQFVAASVTTWIPPEKSDVSTPVLDKPATFVQPEPPLLRYASTQTDSAASIAPSLPLFAHIEEEIVFGATPTLKATTETVAAPKKVARNSNAVAREITVASAPRSTITPGTLRRFRGKGEGEQNSSDKDGTFEQQFPPTTALQPAKIRRPTVAATTRATRRSARFRQTWATGVYR